VAEWKVGGEKEGEGTAEETVQVVWGSGRRSKKARM